MPVTTIIDGLKTYIKTYSGLTANAPVWVNYLGDKATQYSIVPLPGEGLVTGYLDGTGIYAYPFALQSMESTVDELERIANLGFFEAFSTWIKAQNLAGTLPTLPTGKTALRIVAAGFGYLFEQGQSDTGVYQVQCRLEYRA